MGRGRHLRLLPRLGLAIGLVAGLCLTVSAEPAWAASSATPAAGGAACASPQAVSSAADRDTAGTATSPSDDLAGTRECSHSLVADQSFYEAILAGAGLIAFGGATLVYRSRRHRASVGGA
jgi:hypothetical protein